MAMRNALVWNSELRPMTARVPGHKHAAVCMIAAAVATGCRMRLDNAPDIEDTRVLAKIIKELGGEIAETDNLTIDTRYLASRPISAQLSTRVHGTLYLLPALLARFGHVEFGGAGGCQLGRDGERFYRPNEHIISVLEKFGATFERRGDNVTGRCARLRACQIDIMEYSENPAYFLGPLCTGATKAAIIAALGDHSGTTRILNPIRRPEISALLATIKELGFVVHDEPGCIEIRADSVRSDTGHRVLSDLSAIVTYLACAAYHAVPLSIKDVTAAETKEWLAPELDVLTHMGIGLDWSGSNLRMVAADHFEPIDLDIMPEGFATDHQPFFALLALKAKGKSVIRDRVWPDRFGYAEGLRKLGASVMDIPQGIVIEPGRLTRAGETVVGTDLRATTVLLIAALGVPTFTRLEGIEHLDRGYEDFVETLRDHGARIDPDRVQ
jgi:UDP-N-acetylglucosamine 1-carboxyvinyltransferase